MIISLVVSTEATGEVFGDAVVATAILDRLLHHSHVRRGRDLPTTPPRPPERPCTAIPGRRGA